MSSKSKRRVTVDPGNSVSEDAEKRKPSVFERLGPGAGQRKPLYSSEYDSEREKKCRPFLLTGECPYGATCKYKHVQLSSKSKSREEDLSPENLRLKLKGGQSDRSSDKRKDSDNESHDPPSRSASHSRREKESEGGERPDRSSSHSRRDKETKIRSQVVVKKSENADSDDSGDDSESNWFNSLDYKKELELEQKRQQLQRELSQLDESEVETITIQKKNPKGEELSSSSFEDGYFHLLVPNPVVGGNYTCRVNFIQPMPKCLEDNSPLLHRPCVYVEETPARFSLLEARQKEFFERLTEERGNWLDAMDTLANRTDELQQSFDKSLRYKEPIHFHVRLANSVYMSSGNIIKFSQIISNQGQGYNATTGQFTAPTDGNYFFVASTGSYGTSNSADMYLMKGGKEVGRTHLNQYSSYQTMGSCHATLTLKQGEKVWMQSYNGNSYFQQSITSFTGFSF